MEPGESFPTWSEGEGTFNPTEFDAAVLACSRPSEVLALAMQQRPPFRGSPVGVPHQVRYAINCRSKTKIETTTHRSMQMDLIRRLAHRFPTPSHGPRLELLNHLTKLAGNPDDLSLEASEDFGVLGNVPLTGLWPRKEKVQPIREEMLQQGLSDLLVKHKQERESGLFRLPAKRQRKAMLAALRDEVKLGYWEKEVSVDNLENRFGGFCLLIFVRRPAARQSAGV